MSTTEMVGAVWAVCCRMAARMLRARDRCGCASGGGTAGDGADSGRGRLPPRQIPLPMRRASVTACRGSISARIPRREQAPRVEWVERRHCCWMVSRAFAKSADWVSIWTGTLRELAAVSEESFLCFEGASWTNVSPDAHVEESIDLGRFR